VKKNALQTVAKILLPNDFSDQAEKLQQLTLLAEANGSKRESRATEGTELTVHYSHHRM